MALSRAARTLGGSFVFDAIADESPPTQDRTPDATYHSCAPGLVRPYNSFRWGIPSPCGGGSGASFSTP